MNEKIGIIREALLSERQIDCENIYANNATTDPMNDLLHREMSEMADELILKFTKKQHDLHERDKKEQLRSTHAGVRFGALREKRRTLRDTIEYTVSRSRSFIFVLGVEFGR